MKKIWFAIVFSLLFSPAIAASCEKIFDEDFSTLKLMRVSSAKTNFLDANNQLQAAFVVKNDLVITSSQMDSLTCAYFFTKKGTYTAGYLKTANLQKNTVVQKLAGFWRDDAGDNKISVQANLSFQADLGFRSGTVLTFGQLKGRFIRLGSHWRYKRGECEVKSLVVGNVLLVSGGSTGCDFAINIQVEGIYKRS